MDINIQHIENDTYAHLNEFLRGDQYRLHCPTAISLHSTVSEYGAVVSNNKEMINNNDFVRLDDEVRKCNLLL